MPECRQRAPQAAGAAAAPPCGGLQRLGGGRVRGHLLARRRVHEAGRRAERVERLPCVGVQAQGRAAVAQPWRGAVPAGRAAAITAAIAAAVAAAVALLLPCRRRRRRSPQARGLSASV